MSSRTEVYSIQSPDEIRYGAGATASLREFIDERGFEDILVVTDTDILDAGAVDPVLEILEETRVTVFTDVSPEPKLHMAEAAAEEARAVSADVIVGVGGGSCMDTAKLASVLLTHEIPVRELLGMENVPGGGLPTVLIPTTAGTGSEVTHIGVFADGADGNNKKVVYSKHLFCDLAIVDPELTRSLPPDIVAATGMDALSHAIEAYVSTLRTPFTDTLARRAIELISNNLREAVHQGRQNDDARYSMSLAATIAGQAFVNSGLGAVHALTYPLGVEYGIGHGRANAVLLPHIMRYNVPAEPNRFAKIGRLFNGDSESDKPRLEQAQQSADAVKVLNEDIGLPTRISELADIDKSEFDEFADVALTHSAHNIERNPRRMDRSDIVSVLEVVG